MLTNEQIDEQIQKYYRCSTESQFECIPAINVSDLLEELKANKIFPFITSDWTLKRTDKNHRLFYIFVEEFAMNIIKKEHTSIKTVLLMLAMMDYLCDSISASDEGIIGFRPKVFIVKNDKYTFAELHLSVYNRKIILVNLNDPDDDILFVKHRSSESCRGDSDLQVVIEPKDKLSDIKKKLNDPFDIYKLKKTNIRNILKEKSLFIEYDFPEIYFMLYSLLIYRIIGTSTYCGIRLLNPSGSYIESMADYFTPVEVTENADRMFKFKEHNTTQIKTYECDVEKKTELKLD